MHDTTGILELGTVTNKDNLLITPSVEKTIGKGNGFGYSLFNAESPYTNIISARYYKDGSEALIEQNQANPRRLTPRECARLQGFHGNFKIVVSDNAAYKPVRQLCGNSSLDDPAYKAQIGTFTIKNSSIVLVKCLISHPGPGFNSSVQARLNHNLLCNIERDEKGDILKSGVMLLGPGNHGIQLYMDADNSGGSRVTYQKYDIYQLKLPDV